MRPVLALAVVVVLLGGLQAYMMFRPRPTSATAPVEHKAPGIYSLEITLTFAAGPDPFAIDIADAPSLLVTFRGRELLRITDELSAGVPVEVSPIEDLVQGTNEFFVLASPADQASPIARAIRVRVLRDGHPVADASIWSEPGELVQGTVEIEADAGMASHASHHSE